MNTAKFNFPHLLLIALKLYLLLCIVIYFSQNYLLFPSHAAMPVTGDWKPTVIENQQVMLNGQCGKLHAIKWETTNEKGTVMIFHGNGESIASLEYEVPLLQAKGYSVMAWDYAGYGRSDSCWLNEKILLKDAEVAYQWLASLQHGKPIILLGHSVGSGLATYIASRHPHKLLLASPYDSLVNVAQDHLSFFPVYLLIRTPLDATQWIKQIHAPIFIVHGLADTLIKPERAKALANKANPVVKIQWLENTGHNIYASQQYDVWLTNSLQNP